MSWKSIRTTTEAARPLTNQAPSRSAALCIASCPTATERPKHRAGRSRCCRQTRKSVSSQPPANSVRTAKRCTAICPGQGETQRATRGADCPRPAQLPTTGNSPLTATRTSYSGLSCSQFEFLLQRAKQTDSGQDVQSTRPRVQKPLGTTVHPPAMLIPEQPAFHGCLPLSGWVQPQDSGQKDLDRLPNCVP